MEPTTVNIFIVGLLAVCAVSGVFILIDKIPERVKGIIVHVIQYIVMIPLVLLAIYWVGLGIFEIFIQQ